MAPQQAIRKAAILINALDPPSADALLEQMGDERAAQVRRAVMELDDIDPAETREVIEEFMRSQKGSMPDEGLELDDSLIARFAPAGSTEIEAKSPPSPEPPRPPFEFLHEAAVASINQCLLREHPQTIAVVVAHLPPSQAAEVLRGFPEALQVDVLSRVARLEEMDREILGEIEQELRVMLGGRFQSKVRTEGLRSVQAILQSADALQRKELIQALASNEPNLWKQVEQNTRSLAPSAETDDQGPGREPHPPAAPTTSADSTDKAPPEPAARGESGRGAPLAENLAESVAAPLSFDQIALLDNRSLATVLSATPKQVALLALAGARREMFERLLARLPAADARRLSQRVEQIGPLRLSDIEHAQQRMAEIAGRLAAQGRIRVPAPRSFAAAA